MNLTSELAELSNIFAPLTPLYLVGGAVRNSLLGLPISDYDIAGAATTEQVQSILEGSEFTINATFPRTGTLLIDGKLDKYEYTTFRADSYPINSGGHTPAEVVFTTDIAVDCTRRDFTCNALYYDISSGEIIDLVGGVADIERKIIRTVKSGDITLSEDALRLMRLVRFSVQLGFTPDAETIKSAKKHSSGLADISKERIHDELLAILFAPERYNAVRTDGSEVKASDGIRMLTDIGAMKYIIPELCDGIGMEQNDKYHKYDVYNHIMHTVDNCPQRLRLAGLFHDIAKPIQVKLTGKMYGHDKVGESMTRQIMKRLKFSTAEIDHTAMLVSIHMFNLENNVKDSTLRMFIANNYNYVHDYMQLRIADCKASKRQQIDSEAIARTTQMLADMIKRDLPITITQMDINGNDIMQAGYKGMEVGQLLQRLRDEQISQGKKYTREQLINNIRR